MKFLSRLLFLYLLLTSFRASATSIVLNNPETPPKDTTAKYITFKDRLIIYADVGFTSSPFYLVFKDKEKHKHALSYRINHGIILGVGASYKWASIHVSYMAIHNIENKEKYGQTKYFGLQLKLPIKRTYNELRFLTFSGYSLLNANKKIDSSYNSTLLFPKTHTYYVNLGTYFFFNRQFNINTVKGFTGHYTQRVTSWFVKSNFGYNEVRNKGGFLLPEYFIPKTDNRLHTTRIGAFDLGIVPGFAYVNRKKNWQFSGIVGLGGSIQIQHYRVGNYNVSSFGVAPRLDVKLNVGYNPENWFVMLNAELDYFQIHFQSLNYINPLFGITLSGGYRFKIKTKATKKSHKQKLNTNA